MSNKVLRIVLDDDDALIADRELGQVIINSDTGTIDYIDVDGSPENVVMFNSTSSTPAYMETATYDTNINGIVDNSEKLGGIIASDYATKSWVTLNAGNMQTSTYDVTGTGVVDNAERLGNQLPSYYASVAYVNSIAGDMKKSVYDINNNGVVDDSEKLGGQTPGFYSNYLNLNNRPNLEDIEDCLFIPKSVGNLLIFNGTNWVNRSIIDMGSF